MKKRILTFLTILMLLGALVPIASVKATVYKPGDRLSNGLIAPIAYSRHHIIPEINPWGDQIHVELEYDMNDPFGTPDYYLTEFSIYSPKNVIEDERYQEEELRDMDIYWLLPIRLAFWSDILGQYVPDTNDIHQIFDLKFTESLDQRSHEVIYYGEKFQAVNGTSITDHSGKMDYSECKQQILSGEVDSVICEAVTVDKYDVRYQAKRMTVEELESPEYAGYWNKVKTEREEIKNEKIKGYSEQLEQLREEVARLKTEFAQNVADTKTAEITLGGLKNALEAIGGSEDLLQVVEQLQKEIDGIHDQYETEGLRQQLQAILDNQAKLQEELDNSKMLQNSLNEQLEEERGNRVTLETQITELEARISELTQELEDEKNKTCDCSDNKEDKPVIPSCPSIPVGGDTSVGGSGGDSGSTLSKPSNILRPNETLEEGAGIGDNTSSNKDNSEVEQELGNSVVDGVGGAASDGRVEGTKIDEKSMVSQTLAHAEAVYADLETQVVAETAHSEQQGQSDISDKSKNEASENNLDLSDDGKEDKTIAEEEIGVPNLGKKERNWLYLLLLALIVLIGSLIYLVRRKLMSSGRNQRM